MRHYSQGIGQSYAEEEVRPTTSGTGDGVDTVDPKERPKEWGTEDIIHNKAHCVKKMTLKPGYQVSMHWHRTKEETFILVSGGLIVETISKEGHKVVISLTQPLESFTLGCNVPHTFYCPEGQEEETVFLEASTTDRADDSYRIFPSGKRKNPDSR